MFVLVFRQFYHYVTDDRVTRVGSQMWIFTSTLLVEGLVCLKLGREVFEHTIIWNIMYWLIWLVKMNSSQAAVGCSLPALLEVIPWKSQIIAPRNVRTARIIRFSRQEH
ncbi:unnamed protein product [Dibothriocephalus latus]|uniref:Phosphatidylserine synthase n=1 Tax=Dibothriocephalus latus TaxID=60516 RepID=A0A3P7MMH7_DIBLA|nr:unnamed protein product [Dibothriocephalus latus]